MTITSTEKETLGWVLIFIYLCAKLQQISLAKNLQTSTSATTLSSCTV